ncbi:MAG: transposase [Labilithrix sp.]|nr:transposase [Labilithrix sp.]
MTAPRRIRPGDVVLITRRSTQRQFLLRPDGLTNEIFEYCLAEAARRYEVGLVAWLAMSNHYHAVVHDPKGQLPAFLEHLHKMLAKVLNVRWKRRENLWSTEETCVTYLPTFEDVLRKVVYTLANPVNDDLVDRAADWPGASSLRHLLGKRSIPRRPRLYFKETGLMPENVELAVTLPPIVSERMSAESWASRVFAELDKKERGVRQARQINGRRVLGRKAVLRVSPFDSPVTVERRRELRPVLAAQDPRVRIVELELLKRFRREHESSRLRFIHGERDVEFPPGTYRMRLWGVQCASVPMAA